jgi:alkylation response protein AidB-like acyl-CoA dehydrogenase
VVSLSYDRDVVRQVIETVVAPNAETVDVKGTFPRASIDALAEAGVLGLVSGADVGGGGESLRAGADVIEQLAGACGSTAMVVLMHYAAVAAIEAHGQTNLRKEVAAGRHLSTLAFSEAGSRSHFWAPLGTATETDGTITLDATKSWITSAAEADSYVWSSRPVSADGPMTLWLVPRGTTGLSRPGKFHGLGLRGNGSVPVSANGVVVSKEHMLGDDGAGLDIALAAVLPWFLVLSASFSVGLMEAVTLETGTHLTSTRLEHLGQTLIQQPITRADYARMRIATDTNRTFVADAVSAIESGRDDAVLRVLEVKAAAGEASIAVTDAAMKVCGGAAFRKELAIERHFRDARAARVMAPTTDALLDFVGRAISGLPLLEPAQ